MNDKSKKITVEISPGELLDKIGILEIKIEKIKDKDNLFQIEKEYKILKSSKKSLIEITHKKEDVDKLFLSLKSTNLILWEIEDKIRVCEKNKDFSKKFIDLARDVYFNNDKRAKIKSEINKILKSNIREIKSYTKY